MYLINLHTTSQEHWYSFHRKLKDAKFDMTHCFGDFCDCTGKPELQRKCEIEGKQYMTLESVGDNYYIGA